MSLSKTQLPRFPRSAVPAAAALGACSTGVVGAGWGEKVFEMPGTYTWQPPQGATNICIVCVGGGAAGYITNGGGALAYKNNIAFTSSSIFTIVVGAGGYHYAATPNNGGDSYVNIDGVEKIRAGGGGDNIGGIYSGDGVLGGNGGGNSLVEGGCGAGGYAGDGGKTANSPPYPLPAVNSGAAAGGYYQDAGGGVGIYGNTNTAMSLSGAGSDGENGGLSGFGNYAGHGGRYGGGAGHIGSAIVNYSIKGGSGAVRIIWGVGRAFPSTNCG